MSGSDKTAASSWPFNPVPGGPTEWDLSTVLQACYADENPVTGRAAHFMAYTGAHISVVTGGYRRRTVDGGAVQRTYVAPIDSHAVRGNFVFWPRPKNSKRIGVELHDSLREWVKGWLDQPRPTHPSRYNQLFDRVGERLGIKVAPLRFRHTYGVMLRNLGLGAPEISNKLGCSQSVVATYIMLPPWETQERMRRGGFGGSP